MVKRTLLIIDFLFFSVFSFCQQPGPSIEEIAAKFYNSYDLSKQNIFIDFEKRDRQWKVGLRVFQGSDVVQVGSYLFFDSDSGGYQKLPLNAKTDTQLVDFSKFVDSYQVALYHLHRYFGYDGWYKDVITHLSGKDQLSDSALYSLARAYSEHASCLLADQDGYAVRGEIFNMPMEMNCMTLQQREKYSGLQSQAIRTLGRLAHQNPNFETIIGKIPIKYANEVMVGFYTYLTYSDSFAAKYSLPEDLYPEDILEKAQRVLNKCPKDAVLLSLGDNDFYPILYVQQALGLRRDVYLINRNLVGIDRFIYRATQPQFFAKPIHLSVNRQPYMGNANNFLSLGDDRSAMDIEAVIDSINNGHRNEYDGVSLPAKEFIIRRTSGKTSAINDDTLHLRVDAGYLLKNDWVLLDMLNNLDGRKLCCETPLDGILVPLNRCFERVDDDLYVY
jgi:hypothetical protein